MADAAQQALALAMRCRERSYQTHIADHIGEIPGNSGSTVGIPIMQMAAAAG